MALAGCLLALPARAELPAELQAKLILRVMSFDRNLAARSGKAITLGILYRLDGGAGQETGTGVSKAVTDLSKSYSVGGLPVRVLALGFKDAAEAKAKLPTLDANAVFIGPELSEAVPAILETARRKQWLTLASVESYGRSGVSVNLLQRNEKPVIAINLPSAKAEGADLDSALLAIAEVTR